MEDDPRIQALRDIVINLQECPADQSEEFLAVALNLAQQINGLCSVERLTRAMSLTLEPVDEVS